MVGVGLLSLSSGRSSVSGSVLFQGNCDIKPLAVGRLVAGIPARAG